MCSKCHIPQSESEFYKDSSKKDGLCSVCKVCKRQATDNYYRSNQELCRQQRASYYQQNKPTINRQRRKHPEIEGRGEYNKLNPSHFDFGASLRKAPGESSYNRLKRRYKKQALSRNYIFDLSDNDFRQLVTSNCFYCGLEPKQIMREKTSFGQFIYNGIDRVDNSIGYTVDNCVSCCKVCNNAKGKLTKQEWREWIQRIVTYHTTPSNQDLS